MYFWKIDKLKDQIKAGQLSEKDRFVYLILYIAGHVFALELSKWLPLEHPNQWDILQSLLYFPFVFLAHLCFFKANGGSRGTDFLGKLFALGFVVGLRFLPLIILPIGALILYSEWVLGGADGVPTTLFQISLIFAWELLIYWRLFVHMRDVGASTQST